MWRRFDGDHLLTVAATAGYLVAFAVAMTAWWFVDRERRAEAIEHFGATAAQELAHLAAEPLARDDRIGLGLAVNRMLERPEISHIAVYTVDNQPFVVTGEVGLRDAPTHIEQIALHDDVIGDVSVKLDASRFGLPVSGLLADSWLFWLAGLVLTVGFCAVADRIRTRPPSEAEEREQPMPIGHEHENDSYILVANLFQRRGVSDEQRREALRRGAAIGARVADLYNGQSSELAGTGIMLTLGPTDSLERGFEAVCAALLLRRLCRGLRATDAAHAGASLFRYGLDLATGRYAGDMTPMPADDETARRLTVSDVVLLSSLAPNGELVIGAEAYASVEQSGRLLVKEVESAAAQALSSASIPQGIVRGVVEDYDKLLRNQAEFIAEALREEELG